MLYMLYGRNKRTLKVVRATTAVLKRQKDAGKNSVGSD